MIVTRTLVADAPDSLKPICKAAGFLRADIWRRDGALGPVEKSASAVRSEIVKLGIYNNLKIDGTARAETAQDIVNDILTYKAAAKRKVRQAIAKRTADDVERKRLYTLLKEDNWRSNPFCTGRGASIFGTLSPSQPISLSSALTSIQLKWLTASWS